MTMSDDNTNETTDEPEPTKAELHERVEQLESTVEKLMPSRRDALRMGAAGLAGAAGLSATTQTADASTGSAGQIGDVNNRPDAFLDEANVNQLTGVSAGADRQGCRVFLSSDQSISQTTNAKIQFDSEAYDSGNNFDTSSHNWTCPADGLYVVRLQVRLSAGSNDQDRRVIIGTATSARPSNEGALSRRGSSDRNDRITASTINRYNTGDTIAGYASNRDSSDTLDSGDGAGNAFMEVAFLGGL